MRLQSILRRVHPIPGFVYGTVELRQHRWGPQFRVQIRPRAGSKPVCSGCGQKRSGYDTLAEREFSFVPLWGIAVVLLFAMRRVHCRQCGVVVELVPWASGKCPSTHAYCWFLSSWAKTLS